MRRYEPTTPRFTLGVAALAMTAVVLSVLVVLPAEPGLYYDRETMLSTFADGSARAVAARSGTANAPSLAKSAAAIMHCTNGKADRGEDG